MSDKVTKLVDEVSKLSVLELSELVKELQEKLGVSAMPMASAPTAPVASEAAASADTAGSSTQTLVMTGAGANKIAVIKALREINQNWGLKEAKDMTDTAGAEVIKDGKAEDVKVAADKLKAAGATVEIK